MRYAKTILVSGILLTGILWFPAALEAQENRYELRPVPDLWYNDVDGIRLGIRLQGRVEGMFEESPHRLETGLWLGTWLPRHPLSYHLTFTEPIPSLSGFGSEAAMSIRSSIRTGLHRHRLSFDKRWQQGFDEQNHTTLSLHAGAERRFDREYLPWPALWDTKWHPVTGFDLERHDRSGSGRYSLHVSVQAAPGPDAFLRTALEYRHRQPVGAGFHLRGRIFGGTGTRGTPPQYRFLSAFDSPAGWMSHGLTRAKGTIPQPWMTGGMIQVAGGPNLRGYAEQDAERLNEGEPPFHASFASVNLELDVPNPLGSVLETVPVIGGLMEFRSYLFADGGIGTGDRTVRGDAGTGFLFSLNIPDHLGRRRGVMIRYDLPLWLSRPGSEPAFRFRHIIGIGAVITI